ncbi:MAG TPA: cytochrome c family protein [Planctomycetota bacterium]|nr:cytochrome c family protein [Planctomycetota bacterium]
MHPLSAVSVVCGLLLLPLLTSSLPGPDTPLPKGGRYIGAAMCKSCHEGAAKGDQYEHWSKTEHAKAYENLGTDKAKEVGKKHGVDDPQKSEKCLECHVTAYGLDKKEIKGSFKMELGVQCESCHGPGEEHQKKRFAEAMKKDAAPSPITAEEIHAERSMNTCGKCHNEKSPTYKPFCLKERMEKIEHLDPRKKRTDEELAKLRATDDPNCKIHPTKDAAAKKDDKKQDGK